MMQDEGNRVVIGKDENAIRQLISMISSENQHVVSLHFYHNFSCLFHRSGNFDPFTYGRVDSGMFYL